MAQTAAEENSDRKRISIPKVDESVLAWWATQNDPSLSVRLLIRNEIERSGYTDLAFRPVVQQPRRGRPPGTGNESLEGGDASSRDDIEGSSTGGTEYSSQQVTSAEPAAAPAVVAAVRQPLHAVESPTPRVVKPTAGESSFSLVDDLMNG